jgi:alpha-aminoadipic semialdehyde synthase
MAFTLGIRREDKNKWERRVPLIPDHIKELKDNFDIETVIQPSEIRVFKDNEYESLGAKVKEDISESSAIFAVKEVPINFFQHGKTYIFFSHTIKGQKYNMPMLKKMMELGCNLIDYEKITDEKGRRLVFFGRYAGLAGMIDALWTFGQKMESNGLFTPLKEMKKTIDYKDLDEAKKHLIQIGNRIEQGGIPNSLAPLVVGFAGYGNVSKGAQEILDILPIKEIRPDQIDYSSHNYSNNIIYKVVFKEEDMVSPINVEKKFELQDYYANPQLYQSVFQKYIPNLSILINCIYWTKKYPRLLTKNYLKENFTEDFKLKVVGDISVDINGAIEFTEKSTNPDSPVFIYNPITDEIKDGIFGEGIVVMAVDNLPCEMPKESSKEFSDSLINLVPSIVKADFSVEFENLNLPPEIKKALILQKGKLTPDYQYINKFL